MQGKYEKRALLFPTAILFACTSIFVLISHAQSSDPLSPTRILSNSMAGEIKARDVGDPRLTTFYYIFGGKRGDIFIKVWTKNLNGDIEVFTANGLKSKVRITCYADNANNATEHLIYMRKPESLILRVQGRTPNDDPAAFRIEFAGSFGPIKVIAEKEKSELPKAKKLEQGNVKVNSVGTIVDEKDLDSVLVSGISENRIEKKKRRSEKLRKNKRKNILETIVSQKKSEVAMKISQKTVPYPSSNLRKETYKEKLENVTVEIKEKLPKSATVTIEMILGEENAFGSETKKRIKSTTKKSLVIELKNGGKFTRLMNKVASVNLLDRILKVVSIDGSVEKFPISEVARMTIE